MNNYSVESLENGILACNKNIKIFEDAIEKERNTIKEYRIMMDTVQKNERQAKMREEMTANIQVEVIRDGDKN